MIYNLGRYSPILFGKVWAKLAGLKKTKKKDKFLWLRFLAYFAGILLMSFVLSHLVLFTASSTVLEGLMLAFWLWLGFVAPITLGGVLWEHKPFMLFVLNNSYNLISLGLISTILVLWN